jgi:regulator of protease activity HflC (stomatin/prohibitin superfamily)
MSQPALSWTELLCVLILPLLLILATLAASLRVLPEHERGVRLRLGRAAGASGPGLVLLLPFVDRLVPVDIRAQSVELPSELLRTADDLKVEAGATITFRVVDPVRAVVQVQDYRAATAGVARAALHQVVRQFRLDQLLADRPMADDLLAVLIGQELAPWGLEVVTAAVGLVDSAAG